MNKYIPLPVNLRFCKKCNIDIFIYNKSRLCIACKNKEQNKSKIGKFGDLSCAWKGNIVNSGTKHDWIRTHYGNANKCENPDCDKSSKFYEWANIKNHKHTRDIKDYKMMCRKCHSLMDKSKFCKKGHKRTMENTGIRKDRTRDCLICKKIRGGR